MELSLQKSLNVLKETYKEVRLYRTACSIIYFDRSTICPKDGCSFEDEVNNFLSNKVFKLLKSKKIIEACLHLNSHKEELDPYQRRLVENSYDYLRKNQNITAKFDLNYNILCSKSYGDWLNAKEQGNYKLFKNDLKKIVKYSKEIVRLRDMDFANNYDCLLSDYEKGLTTEKLDKFFGRLKDGILEILGKIEHSDKKIKTDFLSRPIDVKRQEAFSKYVLKVIGFNFDKGMLSTTEHPFTSALSFNDVRVTTHLYEDMFISNIYSTIHEGGHALFSQNLPQIDFDNCIEQGQSMSMDESISRFYENIIGRSESFIHLIYPELLKEFPEFNDISEKEFYEAVNSVTPSLIRTEADELTYGLHIIIRYELEKMMMNSDCDINNLNKLWNKFYKDYLGVVPLTDKDGILQDVHWTSGFGYFPSYALGNANGAMIYETMQRDIDVDSLIKNNKMDVIRDYLKEKVFKKSSLLTPNEWIIDITGKQLSPEPFLKYLKDKYYKIYDIKE